MGNGTYYGHGIVIKTPEEIIKDLNKHRKPDAPEEAYLTDYVNRPDFKYLANVYLDYLSKMQREFYRGLYRFY
jgi:protein-glutamine gamma-glutamyltransferase